MRQLAIGGVMFVAGVVVGTAGSDDTLVREAQHREADAYERGFADATLELQTIAVQGGHATWYLEPLTGRPSNFAWAPVSDEDRRRLDDLTNAILEASREQRPGASGESIPPLASR
ncbi:hypothetical protein Pan44_06020 [Caulifigura coniformis]|uniref:Uncharacterized protein n=1 Tax=Caulifigura coniformis TaxID=2527983 RepID=A0A517S8Y7_9PLAN|nr:hypothetical protein [Caulifigura coniformis]QDT52590.1 hypothetical protein Pan44_06020 [Caulifigura coniformis]